MEIKKKNKNKQLQIRVSEEEREKIKKLADKYTNGNISLYVVYAALNFKK